MQPFRVAPNADGSVKKLAQARFSQHFTSRPVADDAPIAQYTPESSRRLHEAWRRAESSDGMFDMEAEITTLKGRN